MDMPHLSQRIEISFWIAAVDLMHNRLLLRRLVIASIAGAGLLFSLGVMSALAHTGWGTAHHAPQPLAVHGLLPAKAATPAPAVATGQHNLLIVVVDDMQAVRPKLEGVWLMLTMPNSAHVTMLPVYPASLKGGPAEDAQLAKNFGLLPDGKLTPKFSNALGKKDIWWTKYMVLDKFALGQLVDLMGGVQIGSQRLQGSQVMKALPSPEEHPEAALHSQAVLLASLCSNQYKSLTAVSPKDLRQVLKGHWNTDYTLEELMLGWESLHTYGSDSGQARQWKLTCEFPTLNEAMPIPPCSATDTSQ